MAVNPNLGDDDEKGVKKALIIGVSDYQDGDLEPLPFCKNDAEEMYKLLTSLGFEIPDSNKMVGKVKDRDVKNAIARFFKDPSITSKDTLLFYFAGHGVTDNSGEVFMSSSEIDSKEPFNGGFPFRQLTKWMNESYSTRIITTLDCCHSGAFELTTGSRGDQNDEAKRAHNDIENKSNILKQGRGKCLIAASESTQRAYEIKEANHGIFTYYLLEGLRGKPQSVDEYGNVTVDRLADYVYDIISSLPPEKKPNQMPIRKAEGGGRIILSYHPELARKDHYHHQQQVLTEVRTSQKNSYSILEFIDKARMLLEEGQYDDAIKIFDTILMIKSGHIEALNGKGVALCKQKNYEKALECFKEVLKIKPKHTEASIYVDMITDRITKERSGEAKAHGKELQHDTAALEKRTEEKVKKALTDSTQIPSELIKKGNQLIEKNMYLDAILCYDQALQIESRSELAWYNKGKALANLSRLEEAIKYLDKALELNPNLADAWAWKGHVLLGLGKPEESIKYLDKALELNPNLADAWAYKGGALLNLDRFEESIKYCDKALELNPNLADAWGLKGLVHFILGKPEESIKYLDKALELNPNLADAWAYKGVVLLGLGKPEESIKYLDKALELNPNLADAWAWKGAVLYKLGKHEESIKYLDKALELNPNLAYAWAYKGEALKNLGKKKEAKECHNKAKELGYRG